MYSWVSLDSWRQGHLCESTASGDILDFWWPVLSHPWIVLDVLIHWRGPAKWEVGRLQGSPVEALPDSVVPAVLILKILSMLLALNVKMDLVEYMWCNLLAAHSHTYCHSFNEEAFINWHYFTSIYSFLKLLSKLISIAVHTPPNVEVHMRSICHLGGLWPTGVNVRVLTPSCGQQWW
jgi:hypothetical protein